MNWNGWSSNTPSSVSNGSDLYTCSATLSASRVEFTTDSSRAASGTMAVSQNSGPVSVSPSAGRRHLYVYMESNQVAYAFLMTGRCSLFLYQASISSGLSNLPEKYNHDELAIGPPITALKPGWRAATGIILSLARQNSSAVFEASLKPDSIVV